MNPNRKVERPLRPADMMAEVRKQAELNGKYPSTWSASVSEPLNQSSSVYTAINAPFELKVRKGIAVER